MTELHHQNHHSLPSIRTPEQVLHMSEAERRREEMRLAVAASYSPTDRAAAMQLYLVEKMVPVAIALQLNVPESTVLIWAEEDKWREKMEERNKDLRLLAERTLENLRLTDAPEMRVRHVRLTKQVERIIEKQLDTIEEAEKANPGSTPRLASTLKQLTESLKNAGEVGARAAGTYDTPPTDDSKPRGVMPAININIGEPRAPVKKIEGESHVINPG